MELINCNRLSKTEQKEVLKQAEKFINKKPSIASAQIEIEVGKVIVKGTISPTTFAINNIVRPKKEKSNQNPPENNKGNNTNLGLTKEKLESLVKNGKITKNRNWLELTSDDFENHKGLKFNGFDNLIEAANKDVNLLNKLN